MLTRRTILTAAALAPLAACTSETTTQIAATLENAQSEVIAIWTAVQGFVPSTLTAPITQVLQAAQTAVTAFEAITTASSGLAAAEAAVNALEPLLSLLPLPGVTVASIKAGIVLVEAFAQGIATIAAPAPSAAVGAEPVRAIAAPVPILVPVS